MKIRIKEDYCMLKKDQIYNVDLQKLDIIPVKDENNISWFLDSNQYEIIEEPPIQQINPNQQPNQFYPSRRDYFAAYALNGLYLGKYLNDSDVYDAVNTAIKYADEMIKQLDESEKP